MVDMNCFKTAQSEEIILRTPRVMHANRKIYIGTPNSSIERGSIRCFTSANRSESPPARYPDESSAKPPDPPINFPVPLRDTPRHRVMKKDGTPNTEGHRTRWIIKSTYSRPSRAATPRTTTRSRLGPRAVLSTT